MMYNCNVKIYYINLFLIGFFMNSCNLEKPNIKISYIQKWSSLSPPLQSSAMDDFILSNQFDPLVEINEEGIIVPDGAKSWVINTDFTRFTFKIDTSKKFSDGTFLSSFDYKNSFENSLKPKSKSYNNSTLDVLYKLTGFENFAKSGHISGIETPSESTLVLNFTSPFRQALEYLSWTRFVAYKKVNNNYIGTGRYIIKELKPFEKLTLYPNKWHEDYPSLSEVEIQVNSNFEKNIKLISSEQIDVLELAPDEALDYCKNEKNIDCYLGPESRHLILELNGFKNRFFSDQKLRIGLQSLIHKIISETNSLPSHLSSNNFKVQAQSYLPFQKGFLSDTEVKESLDLGNEYIEYFINKNKNQPIYLVLPEENKWLLNLLKKNNIKLTKNSGVLPSHEILDIVYNTHEADAIFTSTSIVSGDPDGIYHMLGKNGAILNPMSYRKDVGDLLEYGRKLLNPKEIDETYKDVSRSILTQVPYIHFGTLRNITIFNSSKIKMNLSNKHRNHGKLHIYELK